MKNNRRRFLTHTGAAFGAGALGMSSMGRISAKEPDASNQRFVFIRKSNGVRPKELTLPSFTEEQKKQDHAKQPIRVDLTKQELPSWMGRLESHKESLAVLQGLSCKMSENGHWSYSSVMGAFKSGRNLGQEFVNMYNGRF